MAHTYVYKTPVAFSIPWDPDNNAICDLVSDNVQEVIEELCVNATAAASPSYAYGRSGTVNGNSWLICVESPSNRRGLPFGMENGKIRKITISFRNAPSPVTIDVRYHDGNLVGNTLVGSVTTTGGLTTEDFLVDWAVPKGHQLAVRLRNSGATKPQHPGVFLVVKGILA